MNYTVIIGVLSDSNKWEQKYAIPFFDEDTAIKYKEYFENHTHGYNIWIVENPEYLI